MEFNIQQLADLDKKHIWHPCSQMKDYEEYPSLHVEKGKGVWLHLSNGEKILDAISSWWTCIFGHGNDYINSKLKEQIDNFEHVIFAHFTHKPAISLAKHLSGLFNDHLPKVFFTDNGSSSVEVALKMSFQYWQQSGHPQKKKFVYISGSYHGETIGALSVSAEELYRKTFDPLLMDTIEANGPDCYRCPYEKTSESCDAECFEHMEKILEDKNKDISAVIVEPIIQGAAGMRIYSPKYLKKLRKKCTDLNIHLICDEIATGCGKTGKMMACDHAGIVPDFVTVSKAVTGGYLPLAAVLTSEKIYDIFYGDYTDLKAFLHSHTHTANALACTAGNAVFELFEKMNIMEKINPLGENIRNKVLPLIDHKNVGEIRTLGIVTAIELVKNKDTKETFPWKERIGYKIYRNALQKGVLLRSLGDIIYFLPPYVINDEEIDFMTEVAISSIKDILGD